MSVSLPKRKIGQEEVSALGYGAMGISALYGPPLPDEERLKVLDAVYAGGCTFWDTADQYGDSENLIGRWFAKTGKRKEIFLATKFGIQRAEGRFANGTPEYMQRQFEKSLKELQTDYIDLYYLHRADPTVPIEVTVTAMAELVSAGKVKYLGLSEVSSATLRRAHAVHPIAAIQVEYSPFTLDIEDPQIDLLRTARELGVAIVAYSPLGRGMLTGQIRGPEELGEKDVRRMLPRYSKENFHKVLGLADALKTVGERHGATAGQVALAWLLAQGTDVIPIPGTTKIKYLEENIGALDVTLSAGDIAEVRAAADRADATACEARYPANMQQFTEVLFADTPAWK